MKRALHRNQNGALDILLEVLVVEVGVEGGCYGLLDILLVLKRPQGSCEELDMNPRTKMTKLRVKYRV